MMQHKHHDGRQGRKPIFKSGSGILIAIDTLKLMKQFVSIAPQNEIKHSVFVLAHSGVLLSSLASTGFRGCSRRNL